MSPRNKYRGLILLFGGGGGDNNARRTGAAMVAEMVAPLASLIQKMLSGERLT
jgi:hypothetical protein